MKLELMTPPVAEPVTLAEVKDYLKVDHEGEDSLLHGLIRSARQACEMFIDRKLVDQVWRCFANDWGRGAFYLPFCPVRSVSEVAVFQGGNYQAIDQQGWLFDADSFRPRLIPAQGGCWPDPEIPVAGIRITYIAGYGANWNEVPADIRQGILHWIAAGFEKDEAALSERRCAESLWRPYRMIRL